MTIAIDCRALQDPLGGGVAEYTRNLVEVLLLEDKENEYVLFMTGMQGSFSRRGFVQVTHLRYPNKILNFCMRFLKWPKLDRMLQRRTGKKIDVLIVPNINFLSVSSACPYILVVHDLSFELFPEFFSLKRRLWHKAIQPKKLVQNARTVIAVSEHTKRDIVELYRVAEDKVRVMYPGSAQSQDCADRLRPTNCTDNVSAESAAVGISAIRKKYHLPEHFILYLGTLEPRKNIEGLIQAYELLFYKLQAISYKLPHLVIAGRPGWLYQNIYRAVAQSTAKDRIHLIGAIAEEDKAALYKAASLFVYPSLYEGFGFPPLEAVSCGVPVVASASSSLPETIGDAALLVDPTNVANIAHGMERILADKELRNRCIEKGYEAVKKFTWERTAKEILALIANPPLSPLVKGG